MSGWVYVCDSVDLLPGEHRTVESDGVYFAVFNLDGELHALEDVCTHDGGELTGGDVEGSEVICPRHGARFDIRTGAALCAPAYESTAKFPVKREDGRIFVRDDRWD
jgi:3-phenylpropionate/trans-cinnamate dioxygenase ferredoxin subunit